MSGAKSLRQAVGEPNTEVEAWAEDIAGTPVEWQGASEPSLTGSGRTGLRYTQELPAIEKVLGRWSLRRSKEGLALSRSTGGGYSLASIEEMISDLLETAMEQEQEERINKLLDFQRTLGELNQRMASRSSSGSSQPSTFGHLSPNDILVTSVLRASRGRPSSSSSSSTFATAAVQEEVSAQVPCSSTTFASCPICFEAVTADRLHTVSGCGDHYYCIECLAGHATALISVAEISERLSCPDPECGVRFTEADVQQLVPEEVYHRYLQFLVLAMLDACQHIWCPTCASPIITGDAAECPTPTSLTICPGCQSFICSICSKAYHPETTCQGAAVTDPDLLAWLQEQGTKVKECPQCFAATEKNDGCNHMTCKVCSISMSISSLSSSF
ncbi:MAG: IBR domain-containing protein [archaeon]|nr:IBR domain-containing protein [archaeon]